MAGQRCCLDRSLQQGFHAAAAHRPPPPPIHTAAPPRTPTTSSTYRLDKCLGFHAVAVATHLPPPLPPTLPAPSSAGYSRLPPRPLHQQNDAAAQLASPSYRSIEMLPVQHGQLADDGDEANKAWTGEKRRRKHLPPSSSDAPATAHDHGDMEDTIQGAQDPISHTRVLLLRIDSAQFFGPDVLIRKEDHGDMEDTIQGCQDPISHATDMELLPKTDSAEEASQDCFGPDVFISKEDKTRYAQRLRPSILPREEDLPLDMTWEEKGKIKARLARLRITYYKALKPECARERELMEPEEYTDAELRKELYFKRLEEDESFEWFVHPDDTYKAGLNDYQRIAPRNFLPYSGRNLYRYHDEYHSRYHTYKVDALYVKYYAEISKKIKWITKYLHLDRSTKEWSDKDTRAWRQALKIATGFPHMTVRLAAFAYNEYILEMDKDASLKDIDLLYFEIWRRVAKKNLSYMGAVKEVYEMNKFDAHKRRLDGELKGVPAIATIKQYMHYVVRQGGIDEKTEEGEAREVFRMLSISMHKAMNMAQYAQKKLDLADELKLDKEGGIVPLERTFEF
ncbi:uncharacterized protein LOC125518452 [Triticum urartu]|uniref:uncharacterized protein LOC125518452 n=1 Tax=Triticum urartu TaxID=4572 RepID=UPI00204379B7|nr:uncharacterized protein LOC125518452 [Triticum urartu]